MLCEGQTKENSDRGSGEAQIKTRDYKELTGLTAFYSGNFQKYINLNVFVIIIIIGSRLFV